LGKHFTVLGTSLWDWDIIGHTWAIVVLMGFAGAAAFDLIFLLPLNLLILTIPDRGISVAYGLYQMLPLYGLMSLFGFLWGLQFGFDAYYPRDGLKQPAAPAHAAKEPEPIVVEVSVPRRKR
jgi:hypothetical protein